jgi:hypothetical protein
MGFLSSFVIVLNEKVIGNRISTTQYIFPTKKFLLTLKLYATDLPMQVG